MERTANSRECLDPVISVHPDSVIFEAFSRDESSYANLKLDMDQFNIKEEIEFGTTNIDFSYQLGQEFQRIRTTKSLELAINPEGFTVDMKTDRPTYHEKKIVDEPVDPSSYRWETKIDHVRDGETVIIDRKEQLKKLQKKLGKRTYGRACPNCKAFYFTPKRVVTRGDEAGRTFLHCLACGHVFRRPIYIPPINK